MSKQEKEPDGLDKNRTGTIYELPTGQIDEPRIQHFQAALPLQAGVGTATKLK
jgi:hypothetical protein